MKGAAPKAAVGPPPTLAEEAAQAMKIASERAADIENVKAMIQDTDGISPDFKIVQTIILIR